MELRRLNYQPNYSRPPTEDATILCPSVYYLFAMGPVAADANLVSCMETKGDGVNGKRELSIKSGHGGIVRE